MATPTPVPAPSRNNPISLRIYKAISTNFDDKASRDALEIASGFYAKRDKGKAKAGPSPSPDSGDGGGGGDGNDDDELVPRRRTLKGQSAAAARRNLKRDVEARMAGGSQRFLDAFGEVDKVGRLGSGQEQTGGLTGPEARRAPRAHARDAGALRRSAGRARPGEQRDKVPARACGRAAVTAVSSLRIIGS